MEGAGIGAQESERRLRHKVRTINKVTPSVRRLQVNPIATTGDRKPGITRMRNA